MVEVYTVYPHFNHALIDQNSLYVSRATEYFFQTLYSTKSSSQTYKYWDISSFSVSS